MRPHRPDGQGDAWRVLLGEEERIKAWVGEDLTVMKIGILLARRGVVVPHRTLARFAVERCGAGRRSTTVRVDDPPPGVELQIAGLPFLAIALRTDIPASGLSRWVKPHWHVYINQNESAVRRRYSLAHEFKHILDHGLSGRLYPSTAWTSAEDRVERVCDYFAACLLMPKRLVKRRFFEGLREPRELAAEFGVSPKAMRFRLDQLGLIEPLPRCDRRLPKSSPMDWIGSRRRLPLRESVL